MILYVWVFTGGLSIMPKCPKGAIARRVAKPHGSHSHSISLNPYKNSKKGHTWKGHGSNRLCDNCGTRPRHLK
jgi:hypothetical protein